MVWLSGEALAEKSGFPPPPPDTDWSAGTKSSRPLPIPDTVSGSAFATAAADSDSVIAVLRLCSSAALPETNGALKEVPQPAAYELYG